MNNLHQASDSKEVNKDLSMVQVEVMVMVALLQVDMVDLAALEVVKKLCFGGNIFFHPTQIFCCILKFINVKIYKNIELFFRK